MSYSIREARPFDVPAIANRHAEQNRRDGTNYALPQIFDEYGRLMPKIALALVIEDEDGHVQQGVVFERTIEMQIYGCDCKATALLKRDIDSAFYLIKQQGYEGVHCFVPKAVIHPIEKPLTKVGFRRDDYSLGHFYKQFDTEELDK